MDGRALRLFCELGEKSRDVDPHRQQRAEKIKRALKNSRGTWCCQFCGFEFTRLDQITLDHIVPQSMMSDDEEERLQLACKTCNSERGNMPIDLYKMFRAFRSQYPDHAIDAFTRLRRKREFNQEVSMGLCGHRCGHERCGRRVHSER